uniref:Dynein heavy chain, cytosolic n=1 Tax=Parastrongyloides trichosuri TaxID=131310 RepID=A0A0N4ZUQ8_PARTI
MSLEIRNESGTNSAESCAVGINVTEDGSKILVESSFLKPVESKYEDVSLESQCEKMSTEEIIIYTKKELNSIFKETQRINNFVVLFYFNRDIDAYNKFASSTFFQDVVSKISVPLKVLQKRMEYDENVQSNQSLSVNECKTVKSFQILYDQMMANIEIIKCMKEKFDFGFKSDIGSLATYADWICSLNEAHTNLKSLPYDSFLPKDLQMYVRDLHDSFLIMEMLEYENVISRTFRTLIDWNIYDSKSKSNFSKIELIFNFGITDIENVLIAAFNTGTIDSMLEEFLNVITNFVERSMKFSYLDCYSRTLPPVSDISSVESRNASTESQKYILKFAEGLPAEYEIKLKNFISTTEKNDVPVKKFNSLFDFLEAFYKDISQIFQYATFEVEDGGHFSLASYIGKNSLSNVLVKGIKSVSSELSHLVIHDQDMVRNMIDKIDEVLVPYITCGLICDTDLISSMQAEIKDRFTNTICGEIVSCFKKSCTDDFLNVVSVGVNEAAIVHNIANYKESILWKVDRTKINSIIEEDNDVVLPLKSRLVYCQISVVAKKLSEYMIRLMDMEKEPDVYNTTTTEKTFYSLFEFYVNAIESNYKDHMTKQLNLAVSFFNSCYYLTKRMGTYFLYSSSAKRFIAMQTKLKNLGSLALDSHIIAFKNNLSNFLRKGRIFIDACEEENLTENIKLVQFRGEVKRIVTSLKDNLVSPIFKMIMSEIFDKVLGDMITTFTNMESQKDQYHYDNIVRGTNDFLTSINCILLKYCDFELSDISCNDMLGISQILIIMSGAQYDLDITQVSNKNLVFQNSSIVNNLKKLTETIYPNGENKTKILNLLK